MLKILIQCAIFYCITISSFAQQIHAPLKISHLKENFYVYTTWQNYNDTPFPANGMYVVTDAGVILIDSPWDSTQVLPLLDSIQKRHQKNVVMCIATHYHEDRTGGFDILNKARIPTWTSALTNIYCIKHNEKKATNIFLKDTLFVIGGIAMETYYPGPGHTSDNIVIWFKDTKILYGGCLIKSTEAKTLGNLADADMFSWKISLKNIDKKYPKPAFIIPGHQEWSSPLSLKHTMSLLQ